MHFFSDSFNDIHELKYCQAEEKLEAGGDEKLIFNFIWPNRQNLIPDNDISRIWYTRVTSRKFPRPLAIILPFH